MAQIAFLSAFYPYRGGISQFNTKLVDTLYQLNHQVFPFTFTRQYPDVLFPGKSQFSEPKQTPWVAQRVLDTINPLSYYLTAKKIVSLSPDLLITRYWMPFFAPSMGTVASRVKKKNIKTISLIDNIIPHERRIGDSFLTHYFLKNHDGFVVMSASVRDDLLSLKPDAKYVEIAHPLYDHFGEKLPKLTARKILKIPENKKVVLFFGLIRKYKGLDLLIEAFKELSSEYFLLIAGEPYEEIGLYEKLLNLLPQESHLFHPNYIADKDVALYFSAADVCALPYRTATQSGIVAISLYFSLPILATRAGSLAEPIERFKTGIVVESATIEALRNGIEQFFSQKVDYQQALRNAQNELSWDSFAQKMLVFCKQL